MKPYRPRSVIPQQPIDKKWRYVRRRLRPGDLREERAGKRAVRRENRELCKVPQ